ncbi:hypothetical protein [Listeria sp. ILCC792]|uniref:hypothetical protein n=1 Tax=Listeria sp. ILCC792 TaxID=1918331 RepID=UPI000B589CC3|nr:hypothetical protein [Listeria sp. ILCC792]
MSREQSYNDDWYQAWLQLVEVKKGLENSYSVAKGLQADMESMRWSGDHYVHIKALMEMVVKYHGALLNSSTELNKAIHSFGENYKAFEELDNYKKLKGID